MKYSPTRQPVRRRIIEDIVTFPGYASILLGWIVLIGWLAYLLLQVVNIQTIHTIHHAAPVQPGSNGVLSEVGVIACGFLVLFLGLYVLWIYVSDWTKRTLGWLANALQVPARHYWKFCISFLAAVWLVDVAVAFAVASNLMCIVVTFLAAIIISLGSASFGLAALLKQEG